MMTITSETTVSEVARSVPASIRVFQRYGIDFCCGGGKSLNEVCEEKSVSVGELLHEVEQAERPEAGGQTTDWNSAALGQLIDHILAKHHAYLRTELPRLAAMLARVLEVHGAAHPESLHPLSGFYTAMRKELEDHMWKEENILFPLIRQIEASETTGAARRPAMSVRNPIRVMEMEHESAGNALEQMRRVTADYQLPEGACNTYRGLFDGLERLEEDLHQHIHLENNILFPRAIELEG